MGFLDHSTNNIILDAVLTDTGRQFLSRNNGDFTLFKFALGDDEVNYSIISKYGRSVGREKIEKNTPVFEALTNQAHSQKYRLISVSNPNLIRLPKLNFVGDGASTGAGSVTIYTTTGTGRQTSSLLRFEQTLLNETSIDVELRDQTFTVDVPNMFVVVDNGSKTPNNIDNQQRAYYTITKAGSTSTLGSSVSFTINAKSLTQTMFDVYGTGTSRDTIRSYVRITGMQSGAVKDIAVNIKK
jgi:hypothetical protein